MAGSHDLTHEDLDPDITTGIGNPLSPYFSEILTAEEEKSIDDKGRKVVHGQLWSDSQTGRYLVVALHGFETATCLTPKIGQADINLKDALQYDLGQPQWTMTIMTTEGRPRFLHSTVGACLELPSDLAEDVLKVKYLTEWLLATCTEALADRKLVIKKSASLQYAAAVADAAQTAIAKAL